MSDAALLGTRVGHIRVVDFLAKGGMGAVYVGFDERLERRVALKAIQGHRLDEDAKARFRREAKVLSQLQHPNICLIHEYVSTEDRDFLVLELIEGKSLKDVLTKPVDGSMKMRIAEQIVQVLIAAHERGIIHRDLKPSNVMLTRAGNVKVLDFGLARVRAEAASWGSTVSFAGGGPGSAPFEGADHGVTRVGTVVGTIEYMSPEQARGEPLTPASDMYSFGLLLQELFSGRPARRAELSRAEQLEEAGRGESIPVSGVQGDLASLINRLKSPAPGSRPSALDTAELLRRIRERPRRRLKRLAAGAALAAMVTFSGITAFQAYRIQQEATRANLAAAKAQAVNEFILMTLGAADPYSGEGRDVTVVEALANAEDQIDEALDDQPGVKAAVQDTIGGVYRRLGRYEEAERLLGSALTLRKDVLGERNREVASTLKKLALLVFDRGDYPRAERLFREYLALSRSVVGDEHEDIADGLVGLGLVLWYQGDYEGAERAHREALALYRALKGPEHRSVSNALNDVGAILADRGNYDEAEPLFREALELDRRLHGAEHLAAAYDLNNLANLLTDKGAFEEAEKLFRESLAMKRALLGTKHAAVGWDLHDLGVSLARRGDYERAEPLLREALAMSREVSGDVHRDVAVDLTDLAGLLVARGEPEMAEPLHQEAIEVFAKVFGPDHWRLALARGNHGACLTALGRYPEAEEALLAAHPALERQFGVRHWRTQKVIGRLVALYDAWGRPAEARKYRALLHGRKRSGDA